VSVQWADIPENRYWDMLGAVPPLIHDAGAFLMGEPVEIDPASGNQTYLAFRWLAGDTFQEASQPLTIEQFLDYRKGQ
jgi:hypothetical protein